MIKSVSIVLLIFLQKNETSYIDPFFLISFFSGHFRWPSLFDFSTVPICGAVASPVAGLGLALPNATSHTLHVLLGSVQPNLWTRCPKRLSGKNQKQWWSNTWNPSVCHKKLDMEHDLRFAPKNVLAAEAAHVTGTLLNLIALDDLPANIPQQDSKSGPTRPCKTKGLLIFCCHYLNLLCRKRLICLIIQTYCNLRVLRSKRHSMLSPWSTFNICLRAHIHHVPSIQVL